jgi:hypothetical protein
VLGGVPDARSGTTGTQNSAPLGKSTPAGITPTTSTGPLSSASRLPMMPGSAPNLRTQAPWLSTATGGALGTSSSARSPLPRTGATPRVSKKSADTPLNQIREGSPRPVSTASQLCEPATAALENIRPAVVHSRR